MTSLRDLHRRRPGNRENIDQIKAGMYADAKAKAKSEDCQMETILDECPVEKPASNL